MPIRIGIRTPRVVLAAAVAAAAIIAVGLPASTTSASLSATGSATASAGIGNWCAVPNPTVSKNVYKLSDFSTINAPEASNNGSVSSVRMLVVPVVNNGSFDPVAALPAQAAAVDDQLGVRLWSCTRSMNSDQWLKLTAWRGDYAPPSASSFAWDVAPSSTVSFAESRLKTTSTLSVNAPTTSASLPGVELRDLHRNINKLGGQSGANADPVTMRYSWMLTTGRAKDATSTNDPACASKTCHVDGAGGVLNYNTTFSGDDSAASAHAVSGNSTTYLAEKYYAPSGVWPTTTTTHDQLQCRSRSRINPGADWGPWSAYTDASGTSCPPNTNRLQTESRTVQVTAVVDAAPTVTPTVIAPAGSTPMYDLLRDATGTKIQYVVLEWWGPGAPPADLEIEVFVV